MGVASYLLNQNIMMKKVLFPLIIIFIFQCTGLSGQMKVIISKKEFRKEKTGFEAAWNHVTEGDNYFEGKGIWYAYAFDEYRKAHAYNSLNPELNYKLGVSALYSDHKAEASDYLLKAMELKGDVAGDILLLSGRALQFKGMYNEAVSMLENYISSPVRKPEINTVNATKYIEECKSAITLVHDTARIEIVNMGSNINSVADDYSPLLSADETSIILGSRREYFTNSSSHYPDSKFDENILISTLDDGVWGMAVSIGKKLSTKFCEVPLFLNGSGDQLFVYTGYNDDGDIMVSYNKKGVWMSPVSTPFRLNTGGSETSFALSPSENEAWFVSNGNKNGIGGKDIYYIKRIKDKKWSRPVNAGPSINTIYDEESVRFSKTGDTIWFSSKGHNSTGGFDIFYSVKDQNGEWTQAVNAGYPLNTPWDELFYNPSALNDSAFYFVSNRTGGSGGLDIYTGRLLPAPVIKARAPEPVIPAEELIVQVPDTVIVRDTVVIVRDIAAADSTPVPPAEQYILFTGKVNDSDSGDPLLSKIDVIDSETNIMLGTTASSDIDGKFSIKVPVRKSYVVDLRSPGFLPDIINLEVPDSLPDGQLNHDMTLIKVSVGKKVVLNNILFETGKAVLSASSYQELEKLLLILRENPLMKIEISGHTDNTGSQALNVRLSGERAKAVVDHLINSGIDTARLESKGYGPSQPVDVNTTPQGRANNRRVEFKILEF